LHWQVQAVAQVRLDQRLNLRVTQQEGARKAGDENVRGIPAEAVLHWQIQAVAQVPLDQQLDLRA
jgi:hypothetical protein